ncbi:hypothetical protein PV371_05635 [Streptomyces sp. TX20-6-3]|uniref:hypothetical protein n=1 Tax=Streptomyces sp. TX20-6-3 TaxID=3028705 RepID=UPI0029B0FE89|nr:hypothetical protein [Streptomyces sp. TX20-6-3]MDX2559128.1 hypothetical protein [Streptomyces sp. TX20-6-3]
MSHQQMLAWLDEASEAGVRLAGDRLKAAAVELERIAKELKSRSGRVDWKGKAEQAFNEWAADVVSSTFSLSSYSSRGAEEMHKTAQAIASAKSAMPRYTSHESAKANLAAAQKYRNDPDAADVARNAQKAISASEDLKAIEAKELATKQAAADEMRKLSSAYHWSGFHMTSVAPPTFPPPPGDFVPENSGLREVSKSSDPASPGARSSTNTSTSTGTHTTRPQPETPTKPDTHTVLPSGDPNGPTHVVGPDVRPDVRPDVPVDLGIDSVDTKTPPTTLPGPTTQTPGTPPPITKPDGSAPPFVTTTGMPPLPSKGGPGVPPPTGPVTGGTRNPMNTTGPRGLPTGPGPLGGPREGISGGKAVPNAQGRPQTGLPRSTVIGTEPGRNGSGMGRAPMGGGMGGPMGGGMGGGQNGITGGRRLAGETGGVVGGKAQRAGATGGAARPFTPGGSGLVRGGSTQRPGDREETNGERPDYLVEDEETWQQGRRVAPPVID